MSLPSQQDGLSPQQVAAFKRTAINTILDAGTRLSMDLFAIATAVVFLHRFYMTKSLVRNDPFLMSMACLYLGGKVEDSPKSVRDVMMASLELRYRDAARRLLHDKAMYEGLRDRVFYAERALLYALDFEFNVEQPHKLCLEMLRTEPLLGGLDARAARSQSRSLSATNLAQFAFNFVNDSLKTEACLHFTAPQIAAACIWLAMKLLKVDTHIYTDRGKLWWVAHGVKEEHLDGVEAQLQQLYTRNLYDLYSDNNLVPQSLKLLSPQQVALTAMAAEAAARQAQATAAKEAGPPQGQAPANGAAHVAPAAAQPAAAESQPAVAQPQSSRQQAAAAKDDDYDDLLANL